MTSIDELESALAALGSQPPTYQPGTEQADRILERRARGERITLPALPRRAPVINRAVVAALALAGAAAAIVVALGSDRSTESGFSPGELMAQPTSRPEFPVFSGVTRPLEPTQWVYSSEPLDQIRPWDQLFVLRQLHSAYQGSAAWLLLAGTKAPDSAPVFTDSTWAAREGLGLLARRRDTTITVQPVPSLFLAVLQAAELSADWKASIPLQVRRNNNNETVWVNLKVYGTEMVESPLGTFKCWKVGFSPEIRFYFWITEEGWPMQQGTGRVDQAFGKMNLLLVGREALRGLDP